MYWSVFFLISLSLNLVYLFYFILFYVTHTHNFLLNISPFLLESLSAFIFLLRSLEMAK